MNKIVDIYIPLDSRDSANRAIWPVASRQLKELTKVIAECGWTARVLNPSWPVAGVAEGMKVIRKARGERFIDFMPGWAYPDFTVSPLWQLPAGVPKLLLGSGIKNFPGNVGLFAAAAGTAHVGIAADRLFVERFENHGDYAGAIDDFLNRGAYRPALPDPIPVEVNEKNRAKAARVKARLAGSIYGAVGPRSMQMWNKISEADFLRYFGVAREGFDGLRLAKMAEKVPEARARRAVDFLVRNGMDLRFGPDPKKHLTQDMAVFQMKVYFALLELKERFGLDFVGVQDQLDWIEHYPATDLTLGILNNKLRPESDGTTVVAATEVDDGAAVTMQVLKLVTGGQPAGFNDLRYWDPDRRLYWFVNSGALAPYFAYGRHDSLEGSWSDRQPAVYFKQGGGTCSVIVRKPGVVTWARFSYRDHKIYLAAGRGVTDVLTDADWRERSRDCDPQWPHWYLRLCGRVEWSINSNHPITVFGDHLADLKAVAEALGVPFECYDDLTPEQL